MCVGLSLVYNAMNLDAKNFYFSFKFSENSRVSAHLFYWTHLAHYSMIAHEEEEEKKYTYIHTLHAVQYISYITPPIKSFNKCY